MDADLSGWTFAAKIAKKLTSEWTVSAKGCCRTPGIGYSRCMGGVLRAESLWVETFTGL